MTLIEQAKIALSEKIDSKEKFDVIWKAVTAELADAYRMKYTPETPYNVHSVTENYPGTFEVHGFRFNALGAVSLKHAFAANNVPPQMWWVAREMLRIATGTYDYNSVLAHIASVSDSLGQMFIHPSTGEDLSRIAYTPDPDHGLADRQVVTTLSKLMRKRYPLFKDDWIRDLEAMYRAERTNEIEIVTGQGIVDAFVSGSTCMRYPRGQWSTIPRETHPADAYDAPGFGAAVLRDSAGKIIARTVVWINPDDPKDKRYIRVYGDVMLVYRLIRAGFACKHFVGARLKAVPFREGDNRYVFPYLDGPGCPANEHSSNVRLSGDGKWFHVIPVKELKRIQQTHSECVSGATSCGWLTIKPLPADFFTFIDPFTQLSYQRDTLKDGAAIEVFVDGAIRTCLVGNKPAEWIEVKQPSPFGTFREVWAAPETPLFSYGAHSRIIESDANRSVCGFQKLSEKFYPDERWARVATYNVKDAGEWHIVKQSDLVDYIISNKDGCAVEMDLTHKSLVHPKSEAITRLRDVLGGRPCMAHPDVTLIRTYTGRRVVKGVHQIAQMYNGEWEFAEKLVDFAVLPSVRLFYMDYTVQGKVLPGTKFKPAEAQVSKALDDFCVGHYFFSWLKVHHDNTTKRAQLLHATEALRSMVWDVKPILSKDGIASGTEPCNLAGKTRTDLQQARVTRLFCRSVLDFALSYESGNTSHPRLSAATLSALLWSAFVLRRLGEKFPEFAALMQMSEEDIEPNKTFAEKVDEKLAAAQLVTQES